jgi:hypothetical protein
MFPGRIAFAFEIFGGVDSALGADRMRALDGHDGKKFRVHAMFSDANCGHQAGESTAHDDDFRVSH